MWGFYPSRTGSSLNTSTELREWTYWGWLRDVDIRGGVVLDADPNGGHGIRLRFLLLVHGCRSRAELPRMRRSLIAEPRHGRAPTSRRPRTQGGTRCGSELLQMTHFNLSSVSAPALALSANFRLLAPVSSPGSRFSAPLFSRVSIWEGYDMSEILR